MKRGQCAIICAFLAAIAVGVFVVAYNGDATALSGGQVIHQHVIGYFMLAGAGVGLVLGYLMSTPGKPYTGSPDLDPFKREQSP